MEYVFLHSRKLLRKQENYVVPSYLKPRSRYQDLFPLKSQACIPSDTCSPIDPWL